MRISDWSSDVCSSDLDNTGIDDGIPDRVLAPNTRQLYFDYVPTYWLNGQRYMVEDGNVRESNCDIEYSPGQYAVCDGGDGRNLSDRDQFRGGLKRSEEHTSELQSLMRISYAVFCLKK